MKRLLFGNAETAFFQALPAYANHGFPSDGPLIEAGAENRLFDETTLVGMGHNSVTGQFRGQALSFGALVPRPIGRTEASIIQIESTEQLISSIRANVGASFKGWWSVDAKAQLVQSTTITDTSLYALLTIRVVLQQSWCPQPTLTEDAAALLAGGNEARFIERYGDEFVNAITTGGELFALVEIKTHSYEYQQYAQGQLSVAVGVFNLEAELESRLSRLETLKTTRVTMLRSGVLSAVPEAATLVEYGKQFPVEVKESGGAVIDLVKVDYGVAKGVPDEARIPRLFSQLDTLRALERHATRARNYRGTLELALAEPSIFEEFDPAVLSKKRNVLSEIESAAEAEALILLRDPVNYSNEPKVADPSSVLPLPSLRHEHSLELLVRLNKGNRELSGREGETVGEGQDGIVRRLTVDFAHAQPDLVLNSDILYLQPTGGTGAGGPYMQPIATGPHPASSVVYFPSGVKGVKFWLDGGRSSGYSVRYELKLSNGAVIEASDAIPAGDWGMGVSDTQHQLVWLRITVTSRK